MWPIITEMKSARNTSIQKRNRAALQKEYRSYEEYIEVFLPRVQETPVFDSEDPSEFGSDLAEVSLRKLEERLSRN